MKTVHHHKNAMQGMTVQATPWEREDICDIQFKDQSHRMGRVSPRNSERQRPSRETARRPEQTPRSPDLRTAHNQGFVSQLHEPPGKCKLNP